MSAKVEAILPVFQFSANHESSVDITNLDGYEFFKGDFVHVTLVNSALEKKIKQSLLEASSARPNNPNANL